MDGPDLGCCFGRKVPQFGRIVSCRPWGSRYEAPDSADIAAEPVAERVLSEGPAAFLFLCVWTA
jgi:hypothetical protein